jgi:hypothetical protein
LRFGFEEFQGLVRGRIATPWIVTALSCCILLSERGTVEFLIVAIVLSGTS